MATANYSINLYLLESIEMHWEDKVAMIKASNADDLPLFEKIVLDHLKSFDDQAWTMFFDCITLDKNLIGNNLSFYKAVNTQYHEVRASLDIGFRAEMRWAMMEVMIEES